ncbi:tubulin-specific chaperone A-like [Sycon ciliatum]|uniref:tubulin-specific chaperone A-like n=1 Tax=Sycon ciliatum TaxID=27933 RepID=UPI0020A895E7|eukprot:scpid96284/ scgid26433/ Tubulin-specific chaperone A; TCP1-chaperonin cofactor A; Tubulin-folding cofactor A
MEKDPRLKALTRQTGITKRCAKDVESYEKELVQLTAKLTQMMEEGKDQYDIKHQKSAIAETEAVLPDCKRRKERSIDELRVLLADCKELDVSAEYVAAQELLAKITAEEEE